MTMEIYAAVSLNPIKKHMNLPLSFTQKIFRNKIEETIIDGLIELSHDMKPNILCKASIPEFPTLQLFGIKDISNNCSFIITKPNANIKYIIHLLNNINRNRTLLDNPNFIEFYSDPKNIDPLIKVNIQLDETKDLLVKTIVSVLNRGEKLDELVVKTQDLSKQANLFYRKAKKVNSCCSWW